MALYADVTTYPPLNQITVLPSESSRAGLPVTALLTSHINPPAHPFVVRLHYCHVPPLSSSSSSSAAASVPLPPARWKWVPMNESRPVKTGWDTVGQTAAEAAVGEERDGAVRFVRTEEELGEERRRVFEGVVPLAREGEGVREGGKGAVRVVFAVAFKNDEFTGWRWGEGVGGVGVGEILVRRGDGNGGRAGLAEEGVRALLGLGKGEGEGEGWVITGCAGRDGEGKKVEVFELRSKDVIPKVEDGTKTYGGPLPSKVLGRVRGQVRYMSLVRLEPYWLGVQHSATRLGGGGEFFDQSMDAVLVLFLLEDGRVLGLLAFAGDEDVYTVIRGSEDGEVVVAARNDSGKEVAFGVLVGVADGDEAVIDGLMSEARHRILEGGKMKKLLDRVGEVGKRESWACERWIDGLTLCTWNGFDMHRCDEKAVLAGLKTLDEKGVKIENFLLDDCWQSLGDHKIGGPENEKAGWDKFEPNSQFPRGLKPMIDDIRANHEHIKLFGVWHALFGYWGGINSKGYIAENYKTRRVRTAYLGHQPTEMLIIDPSDVERFYDDLYSWLRGQGVDFVKTDVQHMLSMLEDGKDREEVTTSYQRAWTTAVCKHFQGKAISCMSQTPQTLFHSLLQDQTPPVCHRNSDDFFPPITDSNPWHIFVNAHNALLDRHLNVVPDWDMFQTVHEFSNNHAASRALSGGPIMITDVPGEHNVDMINAMTAPSPCGTLIALRPSQAAVSGGPWSRYADGNLCRIASAASYSQGNSSVGQTGLLGLFNLTDGPQRELISVREFSAVMPDAAHDAKVLVFSQATKQVLGPLPLQDIVPSSDSGQPTNQGLLSVVVKGRTWDILSATPIQHAETADKVFEFAVLGLQGRMTGAAAIVSQQVEAAEGSVKVKVALKALGRLSVWVAGPKTHVVSAAVEGQAVSPGMQLRKYDGGKLFVIDVLQHWKEKELWSDVDEVKVEFVVGMADE